MNMYIQINSSYNQRPRDYMLLNLMEIWIFQEIMNQVLMMVLNGSHGMDIY